MIVTTRKHDALILELDDKCMAPSSFHELSHAEIEFPERAYFHWYVHRRSDDSDDTVEFGHGTLSPMQNIALLLYRASKSTGDYVKLLPKHRFCPALINDDQTVVGLYQFVELLDEITDYDKIKKELPGLSYAQINGALMFLRKISQFNIDDVDMDDLEEEGISKDPEFISQLRQALADQETIRVLDSNERDNDRTT